MSFPIPENATLQLSNLQGNINHQGVLSANVNGTPILDGFPVTHTGTSVGTYQHLGIDGQNLKTDFLNVSGTQDGGFHFWTSNSSQAPQLITELTTTGLKIDHSVAGGPTLVNLPPIIVGQPTQVIFQYPPALDTFGIQYGVYTNPIQVLYNAGSFVTGVTYYGQASNAQTLIVRATTNPSDPPLDCSVFTYNQVPFAFVSGAGPTITQTATLGDNLTLIHDTNISVLTPVDLTIGPSTGANSNIDAFAYHATNGSNYSEFSSSGFVITDGANNRQHLAYSYSDVYQNGSKSTQILSPLTENDNLVFASQGTSSTIVMKTKDNDPLLSLDDGTDFAVLTRNDLTFNSVSLPSTVSTNTTQIATNTTQIATNTTQIAKNTSAIKNVQYASPLNVCNSTTITGQLPSSPPMKPTPTALLYAYNGWYYKNISSTYNNIGWSLALSPSTYTVSQLKGFYFNFVSLTTTSKPFISVYTNPPTSPNYYNSRRSYVPGNSAITPGVPYCYSFMFDNAYPTPFKYLHTPVSLTLSPVGQVGAYAPTENLYYFSVNTNSISTLATEEIIVSEAGCILDDGNGVFIQPFSFNSADVYSPNSLAAIVISTNVIRPNVSTNQQVYLNTINSNLVSNDMTGVPSGYYIIIKSAAAIDRTITYNGGTTFTLHTASGTSNGSQVIAYWTGTQWTIYSA
jgi:hypothetical protein